MQTRSLGQVGGPGSIVQIVDTDTHRKRLLSVHTAPATCRIRIIELLSVDVCTDMGGFWGSLKCWGCYPVVSKYSSISSTC
jgi:hypothetical protein